MVENQYNIGMSIFSKNSILITGGAGFFGRAAVKALLDTDVTKIVIYSRDESKQFNLRNSLPHDERLRFFIGDIRDESRLRLALNGIDLVIHAAALKQVDTGEYNPMEFVKTNVLGSQNLIESSIAAGVKKVIALSTDKASSPINLYGATKLTADKLFIAANNYSYSRGTVFSIVRFGNVAGSTGSVIPYFLEQFKKGKALTVTDKRMTRFWITKHQSIKFTLESLQQMNGGELFVPKIPSMKILDLVQAICPNSDVQEMGIRPGEKLHEEMIASDDSIRSVELLDKYIINPVSAQWDYKIPEGKTLEEGFAYRSNTNLNWVDFHEISEFISTYRVP